MWRTVTDEILLNVELNLPRAILQHHKSAAIAHDPSRHTDHIAQAFEFFFARSTKLLLQRLRFVLWAEIIGKWVSTSAQFGQLGATLGNQFVLV